MEPGHPAPAGETQAPDAPDGRELPPPRSIWSILRETASITTFTPGSNLGLVDWSGDGSRPVRSPNCRRPHPRVSVDPYTGEKMTISVTGYARYSRPSGKALLVSTLAYGHPPGALKGVDLWR